MSAYYDIFVAHFGHPLLRGAKHWAIVVMPDLAKLAGTAYQISGGTETYEIKMPEHTDLIETPTYMGRAYVGRVDRNKIEGCENSLRSILDNTPVTLGDLNWNCQNWVVEGLQRMRGAGHSNVEDVSLEGLRGQLDKARREDGKWN
ncbi:hypothetical protein BDZ89DRAFT_1056820 [Hymenopellis radicata]|nr:hypothetical protein BDZ89DRAFT_1056820 [Hymenopellis radicata]